MGRPLNPRRKEIREQILKLTRGRFMQLGDIASALQMRPNTVRSKYLYPMANEGLLERRFPGIRTNSQAYRTATRQSKHGLRREG